jgi:hypothetical protein
MFPDNLEMRFWHAVALVNMGEAEDALPLFREVFDRDKNWAVLLPRLPGVGLLSAPDETLQRILDLAR